MATGVLVAITLLAQLIVPDIEITFTEDEVRQKLAQHLPMETEAWPATITLHEADIDFQGARGIQLDAAFDVAGLGLSAKGTAETLTRVRYQDGAFFLSDVHLDDLPLTTDAETRGTLATWKDRAEAYLDRKAAEQTNEAERQKLRELRDRLGPKLRDTLDKALADIPVYRLQGGPAQWAAFLVLKDVSFSQSEVIATLSPAQGLLKIAIGLLILGTGILLLTNISARARPD